VESITGVAYDAAGLHLLRIVRGRLVPLAIVPPPKPAK
jgi:hypothetical protein